MQAKKVKAIMQLSIDVSDEEDQQKKEENADDFAEFKPTNDL